MQYILHKDDLVKAEIFHGLAVDGTLNMKSFSWIGVKRRKPTTMCYAEEFRICFNVVMALNIVFGCQKGYYNNVNIVYVYDCYLKYESYMRSQPVVGRSSIDSFIVKK